MGDKVMVTGKCPRCKSFLSRDPQENRTLCLGCGWEQEEKRQKE